MKKISRFSSLLLAILMSAVCMFTACSSAPKESATSSEAKPAQSSEAASSEADAPKAEMLTVGWWGVQDVHDYTLKAGDYFTGKTGIALESTYQSWGDYWQKMTVLAASNDLPDIMRQDYGLFTTYAEKGLLAPLDEFIESGIIDASKIDPSLIDATRIDGKLYGLSVGANALIGICNDELIAEAGMEKPSADFDFDDYEAWCIEFAGKTGKFAQTLQFYASATSMLELELRSKGKNIYADGKLGFDAEDLTTYLARTKRLHDAKAIPGIDTLAQELNAQDTQFTKNNCAMEVIWSDTADIVATILGKPCTMIPVPGTVTTKANYIKPSQLLSIPTNSEFKNDAASYINMWTNDAGFNDILAGRRGLPINSEIAEGVKATLSENTKNVWDCLEEVKKVASPIAAPNPAGAGEVNALFKETVAAVLFGESTPEEAAADFVQKAADILANA